jgi:hypothetical protein
LKVKAGRAAPKSSAFVETTEEEDEAMVVDEEEEDEPKHKRARITTGKSKNIVL